ncbi:MAG: peptidylprolyl isomerase [Phyllobacterium sp.]
MTVFVNGIEAVVSSEMTNEMAAAHELLRQRAIATGLVGQDIRDAEKIAQAIEELLAREVMIPSPTEDECRRHYDKHRVRFTSGELVNARHILFQVTPSVSIPQIRARAEQALNELLQQPEWFSEKAKELSNCPSGRNGGNLGQLGRGDTVPEFEKALFKLGASGLLRDLIKTRYGFHIVSVDQHIPGNLLPFEMVRETIAEHLRAGVEEKALRQYISVLAGQARIEGADLDGAESPLVQ